MIIKSFLKIIGIVVCGSILKIAHASSPLLHHDQASFQKIEKRAKESQSSAVLIYQNGKQVFKFGEDFIKPIHVASITKSILSLAIGILEEKCVLKIDDPVYFYFPEWNQGLKKKVTIKHILTHTSGIADERAPDKIAETPSYLQFSLCADIISEPGTKVLYNNIAPNLLPAIIKKASTISADQYIFDHIFKPLGINNFKWIKDHEDNVKGRSGLYLRAEDLIKIGLLILNKGKYEGQNIINQAYIKSLYQPLQSFNNMGLSLLWWVDGKEEDNTLSLNAIGYLGQRLCIIPSRNIVAVRLFNSEEKSEEEIKEAEKDSLNEFLKLLLEIPLET